MQRIVTFLIVIALAAGAALCTQKTAVAQDAGPPDVVTPRGPDGGVAAAEPSVGGTLSRTLEAARSGEWPVAIAGLLWLLIFALRSSVVTDLVPWLGTRVGGYVLTHGLAALVVVAGGLWAGAPFSVGLVLSALGVGLAASGIHELAKDTLGRGGK